jgi:hypothetical protein
MQIHHPTHTVAALRVTRAGPDMTDQHLPRISVPIGKAQFHCGTYPFGEVWGRASVKGPVLSEMGHARSKPADLCAFGKARLMVSLSEMVANHV